MGEIHVGDKVVVRLKEYFSGEGNIRPLVQGEVNFVNTTANFAVVDVATGSTRSASSTRTSTNSPAATA